MCKNGGTVVLSASVFGAARRLVLCGPHTRLSIGSTTMNVLFSVFVFVWFLLVSVCEFANTEVRQDFKTRSPHFCTREKEKRSFLCCV